MPLYDFRCGSCAERFEARAAVDELPPCPVCGAEHSERLLSPFSGPFTVMPRGYAAKRSDGIRKAREEQRTERKETRKQQRDGG